MANILFHSIQILVRVASSASAAATRTSRVMHWHGSMPLRLRAMRAMSITLVAAGITKDESACHWATLQATTPVATDPQPGRFPLRPRRRNSADITGCGRMNLILVARAAEASSAGRSRPRVSVSPSLAGPPGPSRLCGSLHAAPKRSRGGAGSGWFRMLY